MDYKGEIWKDIPSFEGVYQISNFGNVRSLNYGRGNVARVLAPGKSLNGYLFVYLWGSNKSKRYSVHRLVAMAFIDNPNCKPEVNHINGNPLDNRSCNLEWVTNSENKVHSYRVLNRVVKPPMLNKYGRLHNRSKAVEQIDKTGHVVNNFGSAREAGRMTGIYFTSIIKCCIGKVKSAGGFIWKYKEEKV